MSTIIYASEKLRCFTLKVTLGEGVYAAKANAEGEWDIVLLTADIPQELDTFILDAFQFFDPSLTKEDINSSADVCPCCGDRISNCKPEVMN